MKREGMHFTVRISQESGIKASVLFIKSCLILPIKRDISV
jgi:hypothetical protein